MNMYVRDTAFFIPELLDGGIPFFCIKWVAGLWAKGLKVSFKQHP